MRLRTRLQLASLLTLAIALGALLVVGNVLLRSGVDAQASSVLRARTDAQLAALIVTAHGLRVHESPNDQVLDRRSWVLDGDRVIERPAGISAQLDRVAVGLGRRRRTAAVAPVLCGHSPARSSERRRRLGMKRDCTVAACRTRSSRSVSSASSSARR